MCLETENLRCGFSTTLLPAMTVLKIGLVANVKKSSTFMLPFQQFLSRADRSVDCVLFDVLTDSSEWDRVDVVLQKITDYMAVAEESSVRGETAARAVRNFFAYCHRWPDMVVVEPVDRVARLLDRRNMYAGVAMAGCSVPRHCVFTKSTVAATQLEMSPEAGAGAAVQMEADVLWIVKNIRACGTESSHQMWLLSSLQQLESQPLEDGETYVVQQFVPHGARVFKAYVVGSFVEIVTKESLDPARMQTAGRRPASAPVVFNSQTMLHQQLPMLFDVPQALRATIVQIAARLREAFGLDLLGFDVICDEHSGCPYVIDVNYFPSYKDVANAFEKVLQHVDYRLRYP